MDGEWNNEQWRAGWKSTDVSEKHIASTFKVEEQETSMSDAANTACLMRKHGKILSRVRGSVTNNNGFWIG
jgi:hypothetical protein